LRAITLSPSKSPRSFYGNWTHLGISWHCFATAFPSKKLFFLGQKAGSIHAVFDARAAGGLTHLGEISDISWGFFGGNITSNQEYAMGYNWWILPI